MLQVTRWSPDTCGCILEYEWDDTLEASARTHSFKKAVKLCEHHKALLGAKAFDQVMSENTRKNTVLGEIQKIKPDITLEDYTWSFDANRKLKVGFLGKLKAGEKSSLQSLCDNEFGVNKIEVI
ncbi:hypothetical protein ES703_105997 [subsurface metagenome]